MKEIIGVVILIVSLFAGTKMLEAVHDTVRRIALEKAAQGLPPLAGFTERLTRPEKKRSIQKKRKSSD